MRPWRPSGASLDVVSGRQDRPAWEQQGDHSVGVWREDGLGEG